MSSNRPHIAILGAGPIGLESALAAAERSLSFTVYESTPRVGGHVRDWGHVRLFTPWSMNVSPRARRALGAGVPDGEALPTGADLARDLLEPLAALSKFAGRVRPATRVLAIGREGLLKHERIGSPLRAERPFRLLVSRPDGSEAVERADIVLDCTGTYGNPNRLGDGGISAPGEQAFEERISRFIPDLGHRAREWSGRTILLTGAGHSAQTAARDLAGLARDAPGTRVVWALRRPHTSFGAVHDDPLPERAALNAAAADLARGASPAVDVRAGFVTEALSGREGMIAVALRNGGREEVVVDRILALNGGVGDASLYRQLQVHECYATCGPMNLAAALLGEGGGGDCLAQPALGPGTLVNPEPGFFVLGAKSYGRNSQFLLQVGWRQVDDVFSHLLPDLIRTWGRSPNLPDHTARPIPQM
ncbi:MAG: FAD-dependent oxidoreductase [Thermoleophilaceae bacterium]